MPRGGARPGAGRKPKLVKYERPVNAAEKQIVDHLPAIVAAQVKLALGQILVQEDDPNAPEGTPEIYAVPPSERAGQYLMNRIMGRPVERHEIEADVDLVDNTPTTDLDEDTRQRVREALLAATAGD